MDVKTFRAANMREALEQVRAELGPDAAVLHTREVRRGGLVGWLTRARVIEITASDTVNVPSRLPARQPRRAVESSPPGVTPSTVAPAAAAPAAPVTLEPSSPRAEDDSLPANSYAWAARPQSGERPSFAAATQHGFELDRDAIDAFSQPVSARPSAAHLEYDYRAKFRADLKGQEDGLQSMVEQLSKVKPRSSEREMPAALFTAYTDMIEADVNEETARELIEQARRDLPASESQHLPTVKERIARLIEGDIFEHGPIHTWRGQRRVVALVGPTGVGKTTTVAKLAANYRLREKLRVGLITVDTYRIAAVEQLRTYADIIDLPMEVVSTPREMREAVARMTDMELVLMDTAGRSPRDEVKIQELKSLLAEARADEVHLVLSGVGSAGNLATTAEKFAPAGATALIVTKLDEATGLGNLLPLLRQSRLPLSYLTDGQNVPDDIAVADKRRLARTMLGMQ